ncbi:MAG: hypothetical protein JXA22_08920 [Candidatus Thermoplasmatota archaeon]|nr:hypothetical protein [Candidatus Thermoplasmatota archaeon]
MHNFVKEYLPVILAIGLLIFLHEFGDFQTAAKLGAPFLWDPGNGQFYSHSSQRKPGGSQQYTDPLTGRIGLERMDHL